MKSAKRRILALLLTIIQIVAIMPTTTALAEEYDFQYLVQRGDISQIPAGGDQGKAYFVVGSDTKVWKNDIDGLRPYNQEGSINDGLGKVTWAAIKYFNNAPNDDEVKRKDDPSHTVAYWDLSGANNITSGQLGTTVSFDVTLNAADSNTASKKFLITFSKAAETIDENSLEKALTPFDVLGNTGAEYGLVASTYTQHGHSESNFAVKTLKTDDIGNIDIDGSGDAPMPFKVAHISGSKQFWISAATTIPVDLFITHADDDAGKIHLTTEKPVFKIYQEASEIESFVDGLINAAKDKSASLSEKTTIAPKLANNNDILDLSSYPDNKTYYINCSDSVIRQALSTTGWTIKKNPGQTIVFNIPGQDVNIAKLNVQVRKLDANGNPLDEFEEVSSETSAMNGNDAVNAKVDKVILQHIVYNCYAATGTVNIDTAAGLFLCPLASKVEQKNGAGWIVAAGEIDSKAEWHFYFRERKYESQGGTQVELQKKLKDKDGNNIGYAEKKFKFNLYEADSNFTVGSLKESVTANGSGNMFFTSLQYNRENMKVGNTYLEDRDLYYVIKEDTTGYASPAFYADGIYLNTDELHLRVHLKDNGEGTITPTVYLKTSDGETLKPLSNKIVDIGDFFNTGLTGETDIHGKKKLNSGNLNSEEASSFTFELAPVKLQNNEYVLDKTAPMPVGTDSSKHTKTVSLVQSGNDWTFDFGSIKYDVSDLPIGSDGKFGSAKFTYVITESGSAPQITNDEKKHRVEVTVSVDPENNNSLKVDTVYFLDDVRVEGLDALAEFTNTKQTGSLKITKTLDGIDWSDLESEQLNNITITVTGPDNYSNTFKLSDLDSNHTKTLSDLTPGTYKITETGADGEGNAPAGYKFVSWNTNVTDNKVTVEASRLAEAELTNNYTTDAELKIEKTITGRKFKQGETYRFEIKATGNHANNAPYPSNAQVVDGKHVVTVTAEKGTTSSIIDFGKFEFPNNLVSGHSSVQIKYTVTELPVDSTDPMYGGITIDPDTIEVTLTASKAQGNKKTIDVSVTSEKKNFTNTYDTSCNTSFGGTKTIENRNFKEGDTWTFTVTADSGVKLPANNPVTIKPTSGSTEAFSFGNITYTLADITDKDGKIAAETTFAYTVTESGTVDGVVNDKDIDRVVKVKVTYDAATGTMAAALAKDSEAVVSFTNTYRTNGKIAFEGTKKLENRTLADKEFTFELYAVDENGVVAEKPLQSVPNDDKGEFKFAALSYTGNDLKQVDNSYVVTTKTYLVKEAAGKDTSVTYDQSEYLITVTLEDKGNGTIETSKVIKKIVDAKGTPIAEEEQVESDKITIDFVNTYNTKGEITFEGRKELKNRTLADKEFTFELYAVDENGVVAEKPLQSVPNDDKGEFKFAALSYTGNDLKQVDNSYVETTKTYLVKEAAGKDTSVTYDQSEYLITVTLTDDGNGTIETSKVIKKIVDAKGTPIAAEEQVESAEITIDFVNTYNTKGEITFEGRKELKNRTLENGKFNFELYAVDENGVVAEEPLQSVANNDKGEFKFATLKYTGADLKQENNNYVETTKTYLVKEAAGDDNTVIYDKSVYQITVTLTDDGKGTIGTSKVIRKIADAKGEAIPEAAPAESDGASEGEPAENDEITISFTNITVNVSKVDVGAHAKELTGAHIQVLNSKGEVVDEWDSETGKTHQVKDLKIGEEYTLRETVAPIGYTITTDTTFTVAEDGTITTTGESTTDKDGNEVLLVEDAKTISINKVDAADSHEVDGAVIQILRKLGEETQETGKKYTTINNEVYEVVDAWESKRDEIHQVEGLKVGVEYVLHEDVAPYGYKLTTDTTFTIGKDGTITGSAAKEYDENGKETRVLLVEDDMILVSATVKKIWKDDGDRDGVRPMLLFVNLLQNGDVYETVELNESNNWSCMVKDLPMVDEKQAPYVYTWAETGVDSSVYVTSQKTNGTITTITNTHGPDKTDVSVRKVWNDQKNAAKARPDEIRVQLFANGRAEGAVVTLNEANGWSYKWEKLNKNSNGKAIQYSVDEVAVPEGYTKEVSGSGTSFVITNTLVPGKLEIEKKFDFIPVEPEEPDNTPVDIPVAKSWDDNGNKDGNRPASVTVRLLADGKEVASAQLNAENGWKTTFTGMPRLNEAEKKIVYTVTEDPVAWYRAEIDGYNIRNVYVPETTSVTVRKVWDDNDDKGKLRPTSIYMTLSNGTTVLLNAENGWSATISDLPTKVNGQDVTYTWTEQAVVSYTNTGVTMEGNVTTFTNRLVPVPEVKKDTPKPKTPGNGWVIFEEYDTALGGEVTINHVGDCFD